MKDKKTNIILVIIIFVLILLIILLSTGAIDFKSDKYSNYESNNESINNNKNEQNNEKDELVNNTDENDETIENSNTDENEDKNLSEYWLVNDDVVTEEKTSDLTFKISDNGKISINGNKNIENISAAKSIKLFSPPSPNSILYILTKEGYLYKYETSEYEKGNYTATKLDEYSNITEIITYQKRTTSQNGGCDYIFIRDNSGKQYELDSFCI